MSRRPGIGKDWFDKYFNDVYSHDYVVIRNGVRCRPPSYYDNAFDRINPTKLKELKQKRMEKAKDNPDNSPERLGTRGKVQELRAKN